MRHYINVRNRQIHIGLVVALISILLCSVVYASILFTKTLTGNITVTVTYGINIFDDSARTTPSTTLNFPSFDAFSTSTVKSQILYLKNTGSANLDAKQFTIQVSGTPSGITVSWEWSTDGTTFNAQVLGGSVALSQSTFNTCAVKVDLTPSGLQLGGTTALTVNFEVTT